LLRKKENIEGPPTNIRKKKEIGGGGGIEVGNGSHKVKSKKEKKERQG